MITMPALVAFDLDDTLAASKSPIQPAMACILAELLTYCEVCVISGGNDHQFYTQVVNQMPSSTRFERLHLMPTCGTRYLRYRDGSWNLIYTHDLDPKDKSDAIDAITQVAQRNGLWEPDDVVRGSRIEDRGSQITYSALGQQAFVDDKKAWDPSGEKRERLRAGIAELLPDLEVRAGGSTSIDITRKGIDKAYGIEQLSKHTGMPFDQMLFIGDRLMPGGNDYPVTRLGIPTYAVTGPDDTVKYLRELIDNAKENR